MPDPEHLRALRAGQPSWNDWRRQHGSEPPDLREADLGGADLRKYDLTGADLERANLHDANLRKADLGGSILREANLRHATLAGANLRGARLRGAILTKAYLRGADLTNAELVEADLERAVLVEGKLNGADLTMAKVYGTAVWDVEVDPSTTQADLVITPPGQAVVTVDDLELAQFIYLLLRSPKIRNVLDTLARKAVLILGRFTPERKAVLDLLRQDLRQRNFVPIVFDFERAVTRDFTETIQMLAGLSRFVIADITNPRSAPLELQATIPDYMIPFVPILQVGEEPFSMFLNLQTKYRNWVLDVLEYRDVEELLAVVEGGIVRRALERDQQLIVQKAEGVRRIRAADLLSLSHH
jgi:hypothetical protein